MKRAALAAALSCLCLTAPAQFAPYQYSVGKLRFHEQPGQLRIASISVELMKGGGEWPPVLLDENGQINVGNAILDSASGKVLASGKQEVNLTRGLAVIPGKDDFHLRRNGVRCRMSRTALGLSKDLSPLGHMRSRHLRIVPSDRDVLALTRQDNGDYTVLKIDLGRCAVSARHALGNPDYLVELGWSGKGGWWLTGSIEQTLLRSADGLAWIAVPLDGVSSLVSSYIVNDNDIWLAAIMADHVNPDKDAYELLHSGDGGKSWTGARPGDALMAKLPPYWLEGARRAAPRGQP